MSSPSINDTGTSGRRRPRCEGSEHEPTAEDETEEGRRPPIGEGQERGPVGEREAAEHGERTDLDRPGEAPLPPQRQRDDAGEDEDPRDEQRGSRVQHAVAEARGALVGDECVDPGLGGTARESTVRRAPIDVLFGERRARHRPDGRADVGQEQVPGLPGAGRFEQPGGDTGRPQREHREPRPFRCEGRGCDQDHRVARRVDPPEQCGDEAVGRSPSRPCVRVGTGRCRERAVGSGTPQVGGLHVDDCPVLPAAVERGEHGGLVEANPEGRIAIVGEQIGRNVTARNGAVRITHRQRGITRRLDLGSRPRAATRVGVGHDTRPHPGRGQRLAEHAEAGPVEPGVVLGLEHLLPEHHDSTRRPPGSAPEGRAGRSVLDTFGRVEGRPGCGRRCERAARGTDRGVALGRGRAPPDHAPDREVRDGALPGQ
ncbi:MAG: hypothetical protein ACKO1Y_09890 [Actinomycetota bacterium]